MKTKEFFKERKKVEDFTEKIKDLLSEQELIDLIVELLDDNELITHTDEHIYHRSYYFKFYTIYTKNKIGEIKIEHPIPEVNKIFNKIYYKRNILENKELDKKFKENYLKQLEEQREKYFKDFLLSDSKDESNFEFFLYKFNFLPGSENRIFDLKKNIVDYCDSSKKMDCTPFATDLWIKWGNRELEDFLFRVPEYFVEEMKERKNKYIIEGIKRETIKNASIVGYQILNRIKSEAEYYFQEQFITSGIASFKKDLLKTSNIWDTKKEILEKLGLNNKKDLSEEDFNTEDFKTLIKGIL